MPRIPLRRRRRNAGDADVVSKEALTFSWKKLTIAAGTTAQPARCRSIILEQPFDVIELFLRAQHVAKAAAQFLDDAAGALHVDLARHLHRIVVAVVVPAQRTAERVGIAL